MKLLLAVVCICNVVCGSYGYLVEVIKYTSGPEEGELYCDDFGCSLLRSSDYFSYNCKPPQRFQSRIQKVLKENSGEVDQFGNHRYEFEPQDQRSDKVLDLFNSAEFCTIPGVLPAANGSDEITFATSASGSLWIHISDKPLLQTNQCSSTPRKPCYNKDSGRCCSMEFVRNNKRLKCPRSCRN